MTPDETDSLYEQAAAANRDVSEKETAYHMATAARRAIFRKLRTGGQSLAAMAKRLDLSRSRVEQIVAEKTRRKPAVERERELVEKVAALEAALSKESK